MRRGSATAAKRQTDKITGKKIRPHTVSGRLGVKGSARRMGFDCGNAGKGRRRRRRLKSRRRRRRRGGVKAEEEVEVG